MDLSYAEVQIRNEQVTQCESTKGGQGEQLAVHQGQEQWLNWQHLERFVIFFPPALGVWARVSFQPIPLAPAVLLIWSWPHLPNILPHFSFVTATP